MVAPRQLPLIPRGLDGRGAVTTQAELIAGGVTKSRITQQILAQRWQRCGKAVVLHNGVLSTWQRRRVAVINCGPRALLTSFTAAEEWGLTRWERAEIHVVAPAGTRRPPIRGLVLHRVGDWERVRGFRHRRLHDLCQSLVVAAGSFRSAGPATGLLAAAVQQRLVAAGEIRRAVELAPRTRHRRELLLALGDVEQGADALSEINLGRLCRRFGLPAPSRQAVRVEQDGRRRYLDGEWHTPDGRTIAIEIDGAYHLDVSQWRRDQLRQNAIVLGGTVVLRFPSSVVRDDPLLVANQLRQALLPRS